MPNLLCTNNGYGTAHKKQHGQSQAKQSCESFVSHLRFLLKEITLFARGCFRLPPHLCSQITFVVGLRRRARTRKGRLHEMHLTGTGQTNSTNRAILGRVFPNIYNIITQRAKLVKKNYFEKIFPSPLNVPQIHGKDKASLQKVYKYKPRFFLQYCHFCVL